MKAQFHFLWQQALKFCIRKSATISHMLLQRGESTHSFFAQAKSTQKPDDTFHFNQEFHRASETQTRFIAL